MKFCWAVVLLSLLSAAQGADQSPLQRNRKEAAAQAAATAPKVSAEEIYRQYFAALQVGQYVKASEFIHSDALYALKAKTLKALRNASRSRCSEFLQCSGIASIPDLQHTPPHAFFEAVMKDGQLVKTFLANAKQSKIDSIISTESENGAEMHVHFKPDHEETVSALMVQAPRSREWRLVLIPSFDE